MQKNLTVLFVSIVFLLFVGLSDSYAEHRKNPNAGHGGRDDGPATLFFVDVVEGNDVTISNWVVADGDCKGHTNGQLSVRFPPVCGVVAVDPGFLDLYLFAISVKSTKPETSVILFFTSEVVSGCCPANETVYATDRLVSSIDVSPPAGSAFGFIVNEKNINLTKVHQPSKGEVVGFISVGRIVYTSQ